MKTSMGAVLVYVLLSHALCSAVAPGRLRIVNTVSFLSCVYLAVLSRHGSISHCSCHFSRDLNLRVVLLHLEFKSDTLPVREVVDSNLGPETDYLD